MSAEFNWYQLGTRNSNETNLPGQEATTRLTYEVRWYQDRSYYELQQNGQKQELTS